MDCLGSRQGKKLDCSRSHDAFIVPDCNQVLGLGPGLSSILSSTTHLSPGCSNCRSSGGTHPPSVLPLPSVPPKDSTSLRLLSQVPPVHPNRRCPLCRPEEPLSLGDGVFSLLRVSLLGFSPPRLQPGRGVQHGSRHGTTPPSITPSRGGVALLRGLGHLTPLLSRQPR